MLRREGTLERIFACAAFVLAFAFSAAAAPLQIQNPSAREHLSLNGDWSVIVDPAKVGSVSPFEGFPPVAFQSAKPWADDLVLQEWAFDPSVTLRVPGDWNTQSERLFFYEGDVWYARPFDVSPKTDERMFIHFGAVNYRADVYLNGAPLGFHEGGFTPFAFEITDKAKPGANMLVVRVRNELGRSTLPTEHTDWLNYGGITRDVVLMKTPKAFVRDYFVRLLDHRTREVAAEVHVDGAPAGTRVRVRLPQLGEAASAVTDGEGRARLRWRTRAALWSPQSPNLHRVEVSVGADVVTDRIGFRTVSVRGSEVLLNGAPIFFRGVSAHEESVRRPGRAHGRDDARATLALVKQLNGNFIRLAHYPHDEATSRLADEMGILVWAEQPIYWGIAWNEAATLQSAKAQTRAMVERDRNRASIVLWSIANETPKTDDRLRFLSEAASVVRAADDTRLLTAALFGDPFAYVRSLALTIAARLAIEEATPAEQKEKLRAFIAEVDKAAPDEARLAALAAATPNIVVDDPLGELIDVIGFNQYLGWYYEAPIARIIPATEAQVRRVSLDLVPVTKIRASQPKPLIISEFGADAKAGVRGPPTQVFSEDFQADYYSRQLKMIAEIPNLVGVSPWVLKDFRAPRRTLPKLQDYWNRKGLVDETGKPKLAFDVLRQAYGPEGPFQGKRQ
jgi:beta-glucuronidase